tara:strand:- start:440 stop:832 length:393 start_codon:yes stop_codon:yes gene_type:complete
MVQMLRYCFIILFYLPYLLLAQQIRFHESPGLKLALEQKISSTDSTSIDGFRIQIFSGNNRQNADKIQEELIAEFPEFLGRTYLKYQAPNYKIRVGNYYQEIDAQRDLKNLEKKYEGIFVVREQIRLPKR